MLYTIVPALASANNRLVTHKTLTLLFVSSSTTPRLCRSCSKEVFLTPYQRKKWLAMHETNDIVCMGYTDQVAIGIKTVF